MISIIIPVYNVRNYLNICIESIRKQTYKDFEIILIDDGSNDGSSELCDYYHLVLDKCFVFHKKNEGVYAARNLGLQIAEGDFISFVDADDFLHPLYLEILYNNISRFQADISIINFSSNKKPRENNDPITNNSISIINKNDLLQLLFTDMIYGVVWGKLYKKELFNYLEFKNLSVTEDIEINSRIYQKINIAVYSNSILYYWINRNDSLTARMNCLYPIDLIDGYYIAFKNLPLTETNNRYHGLIRLYKILLSTRFGAKKKNKKTIKRKVKEIFYATKYEFYSNNNISKKEKLIYLIFLKIPFIYSIFRYIKEILK